MHFQNLLQTRVSKQEKEEEKCILGRVTEDRLIWHGKESIYMFIYFCTGFSLHYTFFFFSFLSSFSWVFYRSNFEFFRALKSILVIYIIFWIDFASHESPTSKLLLENLGCWRGQQTHTWGFISPTFLCENNLSVFY